MYLGEQMQENESLTNEYKEFCIKTNIYDFYSQEELNDIINTGKVTKNFNNMILDNMKLYCDTYIPKYASSYTNSKIKNGTIHIGVNDNGEITGIPFYGQLHESQIIKLVEISKSKFLFEPVKTIVKIEKLKIHNHFINDNTKEIIKKSKIHNNLFKKINERYYIERQKWVKEVLKYSVKLSEIVKNEYTRNKFYNWLKEKKCPIYNEIINTNSNTIENIKNKRILITEKKSVIHWIALYKDETMIHLQAQKPENPNMTKFFNSSVYLMTHLTDLRKKIIENNKNINYYKINISFDTSINKNIIYKKINRQSIYKSYRMVQSDIGPYSKTYIINK